MSEEELKLNQTISPDDTMLTSSKEAYFKTSLSAYRSIQKAICVAGKDPAKVKSILDFGCGYGRILRVLRAAYPDADITACDLMKNAVDFCCKTFNAKPLYGQEDLKSMSSDDKYDLIWVGSVFTHLRQESWEMMIEFLSGMLMPDGLLVFTTHGRTALWVFQNYTLGKSHITVEQFEKLKDDFRTLGFGFIEYTPGMIKHLSEKQGAKVTTGKYGLSCARADWVCALIAKFPKLCLGTYQEGGWGKNHDVVSVSAPSDLRDVLNPK